MINDEMAKMAINTLKEYCKNLCSCCAIYTSCSQASCCFKSVDGYNDVGTIEDLQKSTKKPIKFNEKKKESKAFMVYLLTLLEKVTKTTLSDYDKLHIKMDVTKYGKVTIDLKNNTGRVVAHGSARCHPNDTFDIKTGVKIASERMIEELKKPLHPQKDDAYYYIGDYGPEPRICNNEFIDRLNDVIGNCFNNKAILLEHEKEIKMRKEKILEIIADYMKKE